MANIVKYSLQKDADKSITPHFKVREFARWDNTKAKAKYCGDTVYIDTDLVAILQRIRDHFGKSVTITSAYRPEGYNAAIGGSSSSYHCSGQAADIVIAGVLPLEVAKYAESIGVKGIGCYNDQKFNHIDTRSNKFYWYNASVTATSSFGGTTASANSENTIEQIQRTLNERYDAGLSVDGIYGSKTRKAFVKGLQIELNKQYNAGLMVDGIWGEKTKARCVSLRKGSKGNITYLLQAALYCNGQKIAVDGIFGSATESAVRFFQTANGLRADGKADANVMEKLMK